MGYENDSTECRAAEDFEGEEDDDIIENSSERPHIDDGGDDDDDDDDDGGGGGGGDGDGDEMTDNFIERHHGVDDGEILESLIGRSHVGEENDLIQRLLKRPRLGMDGKMIASSGERALGAFHGVASLEPYEGMEFESEEAAKIFYNSYARRVGFSIRVSIYSRSKRDGLIISRRFVCSKEGFRRKRVVNMSSGEGKAKRPRAITREGCKAMIVVKKQSSGRWVLSKFVEGHSHPLAPPGKVHCLRSHRGDKDKTIRELTHELEHANQRCAGYRSHLLAILRDVKEQLLKKVEDIRQSIREIESEEQGNYLK